MTRSHRLYCTERRTKKKKQHENKCSNIPNDVEVVRTGSIHTVFEFVYIFVSVGWMFVAIFFSLFVRLE